MKTRIIISVISAVTLIAFTASAGEAVLSPRALANQNKTITGTPVNSLVVVAEANKVESPRAATGKIATVSGRETSMASKCSVVGTPRQSEMFPSCCKVNPDCKDAVAACCAK